MSLVGPIELRTVAPIAALIVMTLTATPIAAATLAAVAPLVVEAATGSPLLPRFLPKVLSSAACKSNSCAAFAMRSWSMRGRLVAAVDTLTAKRVSYLG